MKAAQKTLPTCFTFSGSSLWLSSTVLKYITQIPTMGQNWRKDLGIKHRIQTLKSKFVVQKCTCLVLNIHSQLNPVRCDQSLVWSVIDVQNCPAECSLPQRSRNFTATTLETLDKPFLILTTCTMSVTVFWRAHFGRKLRWSCSVLSLGPANTSLTHGELGS